MSAEALGFSGIVALLILLVLRVPVAFAMFLVGFLGIWALNGWNGAMGLLSSETFTLASSSELVVVPVYSDGECRLDNRNEPAIIQCRLCRHWPYSWGIGIRNPFGLWWFCGAIWVVRGLCAHHGQSVLVGNGPLWI